MPPRKSTTPKAPAAAPATTFMDEPLAAKEPGIAADAIRDALGINRHNDEALGLSFMRDLGPRDLMMEQVLKLALTREAKTGSRTEEPHAYASEALNCDRKIAMRVSGAHGSGWKDDIDGPGMLAFGIGSFIHDRMQAILAKEYGEFVAEVYWSKGFLTGSADGVYRAANGQLTILEMKTVRSWLFRTCTSRKKDAPDAPHAMQAMLSAWALGATQVHIVYINKESRPGERAVAEWVLPYDHDGAVAEVARMRTLVDDAATGMVPERVYQGTIVKDPDKVKFPCTYCGFKDICVRLGNGRHHLPRPEGGANGHH